MHSVCGWLWVLWIAHSGKEMPRLISDVSLLLPQGCMASGPHLIHGWVVLRL